MGKALFIQIEVGEYIYYTVAYVLYEYTKLNYKL